MEPSSQSNAAHRLIQAGVALILLAAVLGLFIPRFAVPRLALSAHLVAILQGLLLVVMGLAWPKLAFSRAGSRLACGLLIYQAIAAPLSNLLAAAWGAGDTIVPMAAGAAHGSAVQEALVNIGLRTSGAALIVALALILWRLRLPARG